MSPELSSDSEVLPSISFSGSGFLATYQLGVVQGLLDRAPWLLRAAPFVLGASAGSLVAASVACKISPEIVRGELMAFAQEVREHPLGPLHPAVNVFTWIERVARRYLPQDAQRLANGRLAVAMTRMTDIKNTVMTQFQSREDVIQALLCSCFLPGYCGMLAPSYNGVYYVDGGFTSIQPLQAAALGQTLTISPFSGEMNICPRDSASLFDLVVSGAPFQFSLANALRFIDAMYPPAREILDEAYHSGYREAIDFLQNSGHSPNFLLLKQPSQSFINLLELENEGELEEDGGAEDECEIEENERVEEEWREDGSVLEEEELIEKHKQRWNLEKEDKPWTSVLDNGYMSKNPSLTMRDFILKLAILEHALYLCLPTFIQTALLCNILNHLNLSGFLPNHQQLRVMSYFLLPFTLPLCFFLQIITSLKSMYRQATTVLFWTWHDLRQLTFFLVDILVSSIQKNMQGSRVLPAFQMLTWWDVQAEYEGPGIGPRGQRCSTLRLKLSSPPPQSPASPEPCQYAVLLRLDLDMDEDLEEHSGFKRSPEILSIPG